MFFISQKFTVADAFFVEGKQGSVVYFDWVDMGKPLPKNKLLEFYVDFREASLGVKLTSNDFYGLLSDFSREPSYIYGLKKAESLYWSSPSGHF